MKKHILTMLFVLLLTHSFILAQSSPPTVSTSSTPLTTFTSSPPPICDEPDDDYLYLLGRVNELEKEQSKLRRELKVTKEAETAGKKLVEKLIKIYEELEREHERYKEYFRVLHRKGN